MVSMGGTAMKPAMMLLLDFFEAQWPIRGGKVLPEPSDVAEQIWVLMEASGIVCAT